MTDTRGLVWNVYVGDFNCGTIETHNIFAHYRFMDDLIKNARKHRNSERAEFEEQMRRDLQYYYWSKCEWEVVIDHWPPRDRAKAIKVDVYDQIRLNWDRFCDYVWEHKADLRRRKNG